MEAILDTNFIISCLKKKIDFLNKLKENGFRVLIPKEVIEELKDLRLKSRGEDKIAINLALELIEKEKIEKTSLGKKTIDEGLIEKGLKGVFIATLDSAIRKKVPNRIIISSAKKNIIIERE